MSLLNYHRLYPSKDLFKAIIRNLIIYSNGDNHFLFDSKYVHFINLVLNCLLYFARNKLIFLIDTKSSLLVRSPSSFTCMGVNYTFQCQNPSQSATQKMTTTFFPCHHIIHMRFLGSTCSFLNSTDLPICFDKQANI